VIGSEEKYIYLFGNVGISACFLLFWGDGIAKDIFVQS
jgi:hypothetical protein